MSCTCYKNGLEVDSFPQQIASGEPGFKGPKAITMLSSLRGTAWWSQIDIPLYICYVFQDKFNNLSMAVMSP